MYGVPETTSSRVPATRPGRPEAGNRFRISTALRITTTVRSAAAGLSCEMYSASAIRLSSATSSHLTCTTRPTLQPLLHFLIAGKLTAVGSGDRLLDFIDLPFVHGHIFLDRLGGDEGAAPVH